MGLASMALFQLALIVLLGPTGHLGHVLILLLVKDQSINVNIQVSWA